MPLLCDLNRPFSLGQISLRAPRLTFRRSSRSAPPPPPHHRPPSAPPPPAPPGPHVQPPHPNPPTPYHWRASDDQALSVCDELSYFVKQLFVGVRYESKLSNHDDNICLHAYIDRTRLMSTAPYIPNLSRPPHLFVSTLLLADVVNFYQRRMLHGKWPYVFWLWQNTFHWIPVNRKQTVARHCISATQIATRHWRKNQRLRIRATISVFVKSECAELCANQTIY